MALPERNGDGWRVRYVDEFGARKWTRTCKTKGEAQREAEQLRVPSRAPRGPNLTLRDAIALGRQDLLKRGRSAGTLRWFRGQVAVLRGRWRDDMPLRLLTIPALQAFVDARLREVTPNTVRHHLRCIGRLQRLALRAGWHGAITARDVVLPSDRVYRPDVFGWQEALDLVQRIRKSLVHVTEVRKPGTSRPRQPLLDGVAIDRDADLIEFLFRTGLRRAELARLRPEDVDLKAKLLHVRGKRRPRTIPLGNEAAECCKRLVGVLGGLKAGTAEKPKQLTPDHIARIFRRWRLRLGEPRLHAHACRHTLCSELLRRGVPIATVAQLLGHAPGSVAITMRYFTASEPALREAVEKL